MAIRYAALATVMLLAGCSMIGDRSGTEEPAHEVVARVGAVQVRAYAPRIAAETVVGEDEEAARNAGFRRLAGYIFGGNTAKARIAMTAPVAQANASQTIAMTAPVAQARDAAGQWVIRFYMPRSWTLETLPVPDDAQVRLVAVPAETVAALRFSGSRSAEAVAARRAELLAALGNSGWAVAGEPVAWFYDPPWTLPWLRRNEVAVAVVAR